MEASIKGEAQKDAHAPTSNATTSSPSQPGLAKRIAGKLLTIELTVLVLLAGLVFGPQLFGVQTYGILTGSMEPAIQTGALTFVDTGVSGADLRPGDVAAFDIGKGRICTHRVVSVDPENQTITTKAAASHELFTYTVNEGWTEHGTPVVADGYTTHTYLYNTKVAASSQTAKAVFDDVTLINLVEAQGVSGPDQIDVIGHGIQAEGLDTAAAAWTAYTAQNA